MLFNVEIIYIMSKLLQYYMLLAATTKHRVYKLKMMKCHIIERVSANAVKYKEVCFKLLTNVSTLTTNPINLTSNQEAPSYICSQTKRPPTYNIKKLAKKYK